MKKRSFISGHASKMDAHPNTIGPSLQNPDRNQSIRGREVDTKYRTHLAVNFGSGNERDQVKNYDCDGSPACNKVDLWERQI